MCLLFLGLVTSSYLVWLPRSPNLSDTCLLLRTSTHSLFLPASHAYMLCPLLSSDRCLPLHTHSHLFVILLASPCFFLLLLPSSCFGRMFIKYIEKLGSQHQQLVFLLYICSYFSLLLAHTLYLLLLIISYLSPRTACDRNMSNAHMSPFSWIRQFSW